MNQHFVSSSLIPFSPPLSRPEAISTPSSQPLHVHLATSHSHHWRKERVASPVAGRCPLALFSLALFPTRASFIQQFSRFRSSLCYLLFLVLNRGCANGLLQKRSPRCRPRLRPRQLPLPVAHLGRRFRRPIYYTPSSKMPRGRMRSTGTVSRPTPDSRMPGPPRLVDFILTQTHRLVPMAALPSPSSFSPLALFQQKQTLLRF